jgi:GTP cyclohydrolase-4
MAKRKGKGRSRRKAPPRKRSKKKPRARPKRKAHRKRTFALGNRDLQNLMVEGSFYLSRVGIKGVKKPVHVQRPKGTVTLTPTIDIFVDLPAHQKGSHMSRNAEVVNELVDRSVREPCGSLECLCADISRDLLEKHGYATTAEVRMEADYFLEKRFSGKGSIEAYKLVAQARAVKGEVGGVKVEKLIGVRVIGMTACPCAMESVRAILQDEEGIDTPDDMPVITHNQRNIATIYIEVPEDSEVEADDLIGIAEDSFSSPTFEILKRAGEGRLVVDAHYNPKFVEDVVRDILMALVAKYKDLPDEVKVVVRSEAEESIHKHNAFAERVTTLGELRKKN